MYEEVGQIKLFDLNDPSAEVKDIIIEGGDGIEEFMVKPHGLSTWQDEKTGMEYSILEVNVYGT